MKLETAEVSLTRIREHSSDLPWFALTPYADHIYKAHVKPLTLDHFSRVMDLLTGENPDRGVFAGWLREENRSVLSHHSQVGILLDGRVGYAKEGALGDMIEASRLVNVLRSIGKEVVIATPHPDLFRGTDNRSISIVEIPENIPPSPVPPHNRKLLSYLYRTSDGIPFIFPLNASIPALLQLGPDGIVNRYALNLVTEAFEEFGNPKLGPSHGRESGIHQLQAQQVFTSTLGITEAESWQQFPAAFLHPTLEAQETAQAVVKVFGCFHSHIENCPPLYLHPGVATDGHKVRTKSYPEDKWEKVVKQLSSIPYTDGSLTFLEPTNEQQAAMTLRLATIALDAGLRVAKVPVALVNRQYHWTLGSFIAFLQELSNHRGLIVGCDSMPAGHAGPATNNPAIILGTHYFNPAFYCPPERALVVLPTRNPYTSSIEPERVVQAIQYFCQDPNLQHPHLS